MDKPGSYSALQAFFISNSILHLSLRLLREGINFRLKVAKKLLTG